MIPGSSMDIVDLVVWIFLYYKLLLLLILSIPLEWFKGIKRSLITWASQSHLVNLYFRLSPATALFMTVFVYYHHWIHQQELQSSKLQSDVNCKLDDAAKTGLFCFVLFCLFFIAYLFICLFVYLFWLLKNFGFKQ